MPAAPAWCKPPPLQLSQGRRECRAMAESEGHQRESPGYQTRTPQLPPSGSGLRSLAHGWQQVCRDGRSGASTPLPSPPTTEPRTQWGWAVQQMQMDNMVPGAPSRTPGRRTADSSSLLAPLACSSLGGQT
ncbi:dihydropyrimidinase-related protein 4 [Platysternon megacephalum]|uniref:Dihydropyrimidinase-related protein 4 n=1 Tax=Platysternon megacephalum TaxID=55544 RepID=A0A4D9DQH0_9SAUR|nr:dihydropyrimidinase-related protein 4 [Platysternon megacephalum]